MYREAAAPPCDICRDLPTVATCACCERGICKHHVSRDKRGWCTQCDEAFYRYKHGDRGTNHMLAWLGSTIVAAVAGVLWAPVLPVTLAIAIGGLPAMQWRYVRTREKRFVLETRRAQHALPSGD